MVIIRKNTEFIHCTPADQNQDLIHIDCASHIYPDGSIGIHNMCFSVRKHEIVSLCGQNGAGKSTLIEHLNGLLLPSQGDIWVEGRSITSGERNDLWKEVGIVFQRSEDQLFAPTVLDDVMFGLINLGMDHKEAKMVALNTLTAVGAGDITEKLPNYLSGGQRRLVAIAGILAMKPRVIAMDEPTSDLDPIHGALIEKLIRDLRDRFDISVVIATHDMDLAARLSDRVCLVKNGLIFAEGNPEEIFYDPELIEEAGLYLPDVVMTYLEFCKKRGIAPAGHPINRDDLVNFLVSGST